MESLVRIQPDEPFEVCLIYTISQISFALKSTGSMNKVYYIHSEETSGIKPTYAVTLCTRTKWERYSEHKFYTKIDKLFIFCLLHYECRWHQRGNMTCKLWQDKFGHHLYQRLNDRIGEGPICHLHNYSRGDNLIGMDTSGLTIDTMNEYTHHWCTKRLRRYRQFESVPSLLKNPLRGFTIYLR